MIYVLRRVKFIICHKKYFLTRTKLPRASFGQIVMQFFTDVFADNCIMRGMNNNFRVNFLKISLWHNAANF